MQELSFRQIHLDFHTSEKISPIAQDFDADEFARMLEEAKVNSVTCFSRCHHGMIFHDTKFEARHPGLSRNLLGEQIEACHRRGIRAPIYISVGLDQFQSYMHPEWVELTPEGRLAGAPPLEAGWRKLCLNGPYIDYVMEQTREVLEMFPADGFFFDIVHQRGCLCQWCMDGMDKAGLNPENESDRAAFGKIVLDNFRHNMSELVRSYAPDATIFYNRGHIFPEVRNVLNTYTHLELESLPSGGWGYDHFPVAVRYARTMGMDTMGMTGKFQKSWADFGGFKNAAALEYECFSALAEGSKCSVGDQLHPNGKLDPATYDLIGSVYRSVAEKEPWCEGARAMAEIAVFSPEAIGAGSKRVDESLTGAMRMLMEKHHQFDIVDEQNDLSPYRMLILPDKITLDEALRDKINDFLENGGALIASHLSGTGRDDASQFALDAIPAKLLAEARYSPDFVMARDDFSREIPATQHVMYERGLEMEPNGDADVLADVWHPYFNRTWRHFCSHRHTPPEKRSDFPAVVKKGKIIYFTHPIFGMYKRHGMRVYRQLVMNALDMLLPDPLIVSDAPTTAHITLTSQLDRGRKVLHLLNYIPEQRSSEIQTIEDVIPLFNVKVGVALEDVKKASLVPSGEALEFERRDRRIWLTIPEVRGHAMISLEIE